jgi:predicted DNA-binding transcriptional regulator AlpA
MDIGMNTKRFLKVAELAELLAVRPSWIYDRTCHNGPEVIPHFKLGRQLRFDLQSNAFQSWIKDHAVDPAIAVHTLDTLAS